MNLDIRTLFIVHALVSITPAVLMIIFWRANEHAATDFERGFGSASS